MLPMLLGLCAVLGVYLILFAGRQRFERSPAEPAADEARGPLRRTTLHVPTPSGERIEAWLYHPGTHRPGVVVMAPGLMGTKQGPLERFAWDFAAQGWAVLMFDFRSFGGSEGMPRHDIDPTRHLEDWRAVVNCVRAGGAGGHIDSKRIVMWGTSFSGATALCAALTLDVSALVLHVPFLGKAASPPSAARLARYVALVVAEKAGDALSAALGHQRPPVYIAGYGRPGEGAFAASRDCPSRHGAESAHPFWRALPTRYRGGWHNVCLVRGLQHLNGIDPKAVLGIVRAPTLVIAASDDDMIRLADTRAMVSAANNPLLKLMVWPGGHFDPYVDPLYAENLRAQLEFLKRVPRAACTLNV